MYNYLLSSFRFLNKPNESNDNRPKPNDAAFCVSTPVLLNIFSSDLRIFAATLLLSASTLCFSGFAGFSPDFSGVTGFFGSDGFSGSDGF